MMYFKHDAAEIAELYRDVPQVIFPSEIAPKYWSKILVDRAPALARRLLESSYRLICEAATKQGRKMIEQCSGPEPLPVLPSRGTAADSQGKGLPEVL